MEVFDNAQTHSHHLHSAIADILRCARPILRQMPRPALISVKAEQTTAPHASISARSTSKARPAEPDRPAVGEQLATMRRQEEAPELDARRYFESGIHRPPL
jgi:hypothetical protein